MQFFWTIVALVVVLGLCWRFLGSYMEAVFAGRVHWLGWVERPVLLGSRHQPRPGTELETLRRGTDHLLRSIDHDHLLDHPHPRLASAQPATPRGSAACLVLEHGCLVRDEHQLAELRRRVDHVLPVADGRPHGSAVREHGCGNSAGHRARARLCTSQLSDDRQLLGGHHTRLALHRAADRLRLRAHLRRPGRGTDSERPMFTSTTS